MAVLTIALMAQSPKGNKSGGGSPMKVCTTDNYDSGKSNNEHTTYLI